MMMSADSGLWSVTEQEPPFRILLLAGVQKNRNETSNFDLLT